MNIKSLLILTVLTPLINALFSVIFKNKKASIISTLISSTTCLTLSSILLNVACKKKSISFVLGNFSRKLGIEVVANIQNTSTILLISFLYLCTAILSIGKVEREIHLNNVPIFYSLLSLVSAGLIGISISNDLFNIFVFIEIASISSYALTAIGKNKKSLLASIDYLITTSLGSAFYLIGIGILFYATGLLNITEIKLYLKSTPELRNTNLLLLSKVSIFIAMLIKSSMFPMNFWLVRVYKYAPINFCSFTSSITTKVYLIAMIKILFFTFGKKDIATTLLTEKVFLYFGGISALICATIASFQLNLRSLLANSGIAHICYIFLCVCLNSRSSIIAAVLFIVSHALSKFILFSSLSLIPKKDLYGSTNSMNYIPHQSTIVSAANIISIASISGIPGTIGFLAKFYMLKSIIDANLYCLFFILILSSIVGSIYCAKLVFSIIFYKDQKYTITKKSIIFPNFCPTIVCSLLLLSMGIYSSPLISIAKKISMYTLYLSR